MLTFAIGDIHGCLSHLVLLITKCNGFADGREARFVFLGDYVDRGPESARTLAFLDDFAKAQPAVFLRGNHDQNFLDWHQDRSRAEPSDLTLRSFENIDFTIERAAQFIQETRLFLRDGVHLYVHAGVNPDAPFSDQKPYDLLCIRDHFLYHAQPFEAYIVHGHTPRMNGLPDIRDIRTNLDTGACFGLSLTAGVFVSDVAKPIAILQVTAEEALRVGISK